MKMWNKRTFLNASGKVSLEEGKSELNSKGWLEGI